MEVVGAPGVLFCRRWRRRALARSVLTVVVWFSLWDLSQLINSLRQKTHIRPHTHTHTQMLIMWSGYMERAAAWRKSKENTPFSSRCVCPSPCATLKAAFLFHQALLLFTLQHVGWSPVGIMSPRLTCRDNQTVWGCNVGLVPWRGIFPRFMDAFKGHVTQKWTGDDKGTTKRGLIGGLCLQVFFFCFLFWPATGFCALFWR